MDGTIRIGRRGALILPAKLRRQHGIRPGDVIRVLDLDGAIVLIPMTQTVSDLAGEIERLRLAARITTDELLAGLRDHRERYFAEHYAHPSGLRTSSP